ncbi:flexible cuticle protein 12-like [Leptinotarsa decemlineata]|uniref:Cuticular protein 23 n=1 Tax=Leptinotarsa decemlineata TaxID=7539 RepID=A0A3S7SJQ5_LEPDE|nr:flexible cuticle protein 12-like [Leptinotarsa decemlineata]AYA49900.1 cuticular protein 23 [Leptinotarsa decemlineata]
MKVIALFFVVISVAVAAPPRVSGDDSKHAVILRYDSDNIGVGSYSYGVETSDGQQKEERGELVNAGSKDEHIAVQGKFSYPGLDGVLYEVVYIADKDGFRAQGAHLPVAPQ